MQVDNLEKLQLSLPKSIFNVLQSIVELYEKIDENISQEDELLDDIKKISDKVKRDFSTHRKGIYKECNEAVYSLGCITEELKIAQEEKKFNHTTLKEIKVFTKELSKSLEISIRNHS